MENIDNSFQNLKLVLDHSKIGSNEMAEQKIDFHKSRTNSTMNQRFPKTSLNMYSIEPIYVRNKEIQVEFMKKTRNTNLQLSNFSEKQKISKHSQILLNNLVDSKILSRHDKCFIKRHLYSQLHNKNYYVKHYTNLMHPCELFLTIQPCNEYPKIIFENLRKLFIKCPNKRFKIAIEV